MWICVVFVPEMFPWFAKMSGTNTCGTLFIVKDLNSPFSGNEAKSWKILVGTWSSSESKWSPLSVNGSPKRSRFPVWQLSNRKIILMAASFASDLLSEWRPYKLQHSVEIKENFLQFFTWNQCNCNSTVWKSSKTRSLFLQKITIFSRQIDDFTKEITKEPI